MLATAASLKRIGHYTPEDCVALAEQFESQSAETLLEWAVDIFAPQLVMTSSFGPEGIVLIDLLSRIASDIPVIYLDTGFHFAATTQVKDAVRERFNLNLIEQRSALSFEQQEAVYGKESFLTNADLCCQLRKV
ncbi:MAG: phosphoadenosine phosphosulfate reductase family protein, partial [Acidobacteria bacterium]|nr:phosphoadenosine phosphosulfate reductase family protein [Acidobacteriota bacterium]